MTDKEKIMIDGVDVSGCRFLDVEEDREDYPEMGGRYTAYECILTSRDCECSNDCYYKQLKRKEQECEKYKQALDEILSISTNSDMLPCADPDADCTKCKDKMTEKGKRCMRYGLEKIKNVVEKAKDCKNEQL